MSAVWGVGKGGARLLSIIRLFSVICNIVTWSKYFTRERSGRCTQCFHFIIQIPRAHQSIGSIWFYGSKQSAGTMVYYFFFYYQFLFIQLSILYPFRCWNGRPKKAWNVGHYTELLLFGGWSACWFIVLVMPRLGDITIDCFGAATFIHRLLLDCAWIGALAVGAERLFKSQKTNQESSSCEWHRIIGANITATWI